MYNMKALDRKLNRLSRPPSKLRDVCIWLSKLLSCISHREITTYLLEQGLIWLNWWDIIKLWLCQLFSQNFISLEMAFDQAEAQNNPGNQKIYYVFSETLLNNQNAEAA